jgi:methylated-DNA-[protein]-cysteine S-methyltransferase
LLLKKNIPMYTTILSTPIGNLGITIRDNKLSNIDFLTFEHPTKPSDHPLSHQITTELLSYFQNSQHHFQLPIELSGTVFQKKVWQALWEIPPGTTVSYGELAKQLKTSSRAIGNACRRNPIPIVVPCHRIVAKASIGGFVGKTNGGMIDIKQWLLAHEKGA